MMRHKTPSVPRPALPWAVTRAVVAEPTRTARLDHPGYKYRIALSCISSTEYESYQAQADANVCTVDQTFLPSFSCITSVSLVMPTGYSSLYDTTLTHMLLLHDISAVSRPWWWRWIRRHVDHPVQPGRRNIRQTSRHCSPYLCLLNRGHRKRTRHPLILLLLIRPKRLINIAHQSLPLLEFLLGCAFLEMRVVPGSSMRTTSFHIVCFFRRRSTGVQTKVRPFRCYKLVEQRVEACTAVGSVHRTDAPAGQMNRRRMRIKNALRRGRREWHICQVILLALPADSSTERFERSCSKEGMSCLFRIR